MRALKNGLIVIVVAAAIAACSTTPPVESGFLSDYSQLKPDKYGNAGLRWTEVPGFDWKQYREVQLDPVLIYYHPSAKNRQIQPDDLKMLADYFREAVIAELQGTYTVTTTPGPDVLRIRAAITDVVPASPGVNAVTTLVAFVPLDLGGAAIEVEFLDSVSGKQLAAMVERKKGSPVNLAGGFTELGYAKAAFREWATDLKRALSSNP